MPLRSLEFAKLWHHVYLSALDKVHIDQADACAHLDADLIADAGACKLGRWLKLMPDHIKRMPAFSQLDAAHNRFHQLASEHVLACERQHAQQANRMLSDELKACSQAIDQALDALAAELPPLDRVS